MSQDKLLIVATDTHTPHRAPTWPRIVDLAVAGLLISTAALKVLAPSDAISAAAVFGVAYWVVILVVQLEVLIAALLIVGRRPRESRLIAAMLFGVFGGGSLTLAFNGHQSCGCFGHLKINPWAIVALDAASLTVLLIAARDHAQPATNPRILQWGGVAGLYGVLAVPALVLMTIHQPTELGGYARIDGSAELIILEPETWIGKEFPLTSFLSPRVSLESGEWTVLIYHHDCPECQRAIPKYIELAGETDNNISRVVLIEVPPPGGPQDFGPALHTKLSSEKEWFVEAPVVLVLRQGRVISVMRNTLPGRKTSNMTEGPYQQRDNDATAQRCHARNFVQLTKCMRETSASLK